MSEEQTWRALASKTSRKINFGWWLQILGTPLLISSLIIACGILITRRELNSLPLLEVGIGTLLILAITSLACWLAARSRFESSDQSLVRIEASMRLRNALSAADKGLTSWPEVPEIINDGTSWHWKRILPSLIGALLIITCGFLIPIHATTNESDTAQEPSTWSDLDTNLDQLENQEVVQPEYLEETRKKLEKLREQSPDDWFSHSSLEATDNLKQNHQTEQETLRNNLQRAEKNLAELQRGGSNLNNAKKKRLLEDFDEALKKMEQGGMKPNKELLEKLKELDLEALDQLTPEEMNQLRENMRQHAEKLKQQGGDAQPEEQNGDGEAEEGEQAEGEQQPGNRPGEGAADRGPGTAPNLLGKPSDDAGKGKLEKLESEDKDRALPGDLLETHDGQHDVDKTKKGPTNGGKANSKGQGGDRVWKDSLLPEEKKALKNFFE